MPSVTQRIKSIKQPYGGYVAVSDFDVVQLPISEELSLNENIHASLIGLAVDYLTRYMSGSSRLKAFKFSLKGARVISRNIIAFYYLLNINGLSNRSIKYACKLVGFDVCYRTGGKGYKSTLRIRPNASTINNIRIMVNRSLDFIDRYGPITKDGFTFKGAYTRQISAGDGDFLTKDTLWDFKVSVNRPTKDHTLQLLVYWIMGINSRHKKSFKSIRNLGIYNPRFNRVYLRPIAKISKDTILTVASKVVGYKP